MTDLTDEELRARADGFQARSEFEQLEGAFDQVRASMLEVIATSKLGETVLREKVYLGVSTLDQVRTILLTVAAGVDVTEHNALIRAVLAGEDPDQSA